MSEPIMQDDIAKRFLDSVERMRNGLRAENALLRRRVDLLASRATTDSILDARVRRLEGKSADDEVFDGLSHVAICTPLWCQFARVECSAQFMILGYDDHMAPVRIACKDARELATELRVFWPGKVSIMAHGNSDPALKLMKP